MSKPSEEKTRAFIGLLKYLKVPMKETAILTHCMETEEMITEAYYKMKEKDFNLTAQETMNICGQVIMKHQKQE